MEEKKTVIDESTLGAAVPLELAETEELNNSETLISPDEIESLSKNHLIDVLNEFLTFENVEPLANLAKLINERFEKLVKEEQEYKLKQFTQDGSIEEDAEPAVDPLDKKFEFLYKSFRKKITGQRVQKEKSALENLATKKLIIEELKNLLKSNDNFTSSYNKFQALQSKWRSTGNVPKLDENTLYENHHFLTGKFYDMVKISNELRELDKKKNIEMKTQLCEKVENLLNQPSLKKSLSELSYLQKEWRESGYLAKELSDDLWKRFKTASDKIQARKKEHYAKVKQQQEANLSAKIALCDELETLTKSEFTSFKIAREASEKAEAIYAQWQKIGFVPKSENGACWKRFKKARHQFYNVLDVFYAKQRSEFDGNLKKKVELCVKAESLQESTEWIATAEALKKLQVEWKNIGPVARKDSDAIWSRFRKACDLFFSNKVKHEAAAEGVLKVNVVAREALIDKINTLQLASEINENIAVLKQLQEEWQNAGEVPVREESRLNNVFGIAVEKLCGRITASFPENHKLIQRIKYEQMLKTPKGVEQVKRERSVIKDRIKKLETEITNIENNLSFFGNSKSANPLLTEYTDKVSKGKLEINELKSQLQSIPSVDPPQVVEVILPKKGRKNNLKKY